jgi:hypothetical protein
MSEHGVFSGSMGMAPHHHVMGLPKPVVSMTGAHGVDTLPGIVRNPKPSDYAMPAVSKIVGMPQKHIAYESRMKMEKVKPSATKATPGMIALELR